MWRWPYVAFLLTIVAGCGGDGSPLGSTGSPLGRYTLRTVNGQALPATVALAANVRVTFISGEFTLGTGGVVTGSSESRSEVTGIAPVNSRSTSSGTYVIHQGSTLSTTMTTTINGFTSRAITVQWSIGGDGAVSATVENISYVYRR